MHEKDPERISFLNGAITKLTKSNQIVTWGRLTPFLNQYSFAHNLTV